MTTDKELREEWHRYVNDDLLKISYKDAEKFICDFFLSHRQKDREELRKEIERMLKENETMSDEYALGYDKALFDILSLVTKSKI